MKTAAIQTQSNSPAGRPLAAAAALPALSALSTFDRSFLKLVNAQRAAAGLVQLREVVGLDSMSGAWSTTMAAAGKYGKLTDNPNAAAQTLTSGASTRTVYAAMSAKWFPRTVTVATALSLFTGNARDAAALLNPAYRFVGLRTVTSADGTSFHTLTLTDKADAAQIVGISMLLGNLDHVRQVSSNLSITGWAADAAYPTTPVTLTLRVTGPTGVSNTTVVPANARPDVVTFYASKGITLVANTGFSVLVPVRGRGSNSVLATITPLDGQSAPRTLAGITITVT